MARVRQPLPGREPFFSRCTLVSLLVAATLATSADAAELPLPSAAKSVSTDIAAACPDCVTAGYVACGTQDVRWGKAFTKTAFQGDPPRAYLPTFTMSGDQFRHLARTTDYATLLTTLHDCFATTRLVVIEQRFTNARVLPPPTNVIVTFPTPLHTCVHDTDHPWGCCVGDCRKECCEKSLGSPDVVLEWKDGEERVTFHYSPTIGTSWLQRTTRNHRVRYACLNDAKGELR